MTEKTDKTTVLATVLPLSSEKTKVDTESVLPSRVGPPGPPSGGQSTTPAAKATHCEACLDYVDRRRNTLLPHIGREVTTTGKPPAKILQRITDRYHQLGHPTPKTATPPTSEATKALRRLASRKKPA